MFTIFQFHKRFDACHLHRMILPSRYCDKELKEEGINLIVSTLGPTEEQKKQIDIFSWHGPPDSQNMIMECLDMQRKGIRLCMMLDDDYITIPPWNPVNISEDTKKGFHFALHMSNFINASTRHLADKLGTNVAVTPNLIDPTDYKYDTENRPLWYNGIVRIAWVGSHTHLGDQEHIVEPITHILEKYRNKVEFVFFSQCHPEIMKRHLYKGVNINGAVGLGEYPYALSQLYANIWLAPLDDCEFNSSKSSLKVLEGMSLGTPVVASMVKPYYQTITDNVNGLLIPDNNEDCWVEALSKLIESPTERNRLGSTGYQLVMDKYNWTKKECRAEWVNFYKSLRDVTMREKGLTI